MAKSYRRLHEQVIARPGASEQLAALRAETLSEIELHDARRAGKGITRPTTPPQDRRG
ncbi:MAG: hypothetical protein OXG38_08470 [Chloroflexi bacterium]|nr:hypothetical protein [Chloroflexota bacterium]